MMENDDRRQHVENGAMLLDEHQPDWALRVAPERLYMPNPEQCVLGQLYPAGFLYALSELGIVHANESEWQQAQYIFLNRLPTPEEAEDIYEHAFDAGVPDELWVEAINSRRLPENL